jgi:hypothetical protein
MNELDAIRLIVANFPGGLEVVALRIGKPSAETLRKELAGAPGFKFSLAHARQISILAIEAQSPHCYAFANVIAGDAGQMIGLPARDMAEKHDLRADTAGLLKEASDALGVITEALADELISDNELKRIERETAEVIEKAQDVLRDARERNAASKPALRVA